jgi:hypothetical protein
VDQLVKWSNEANLIPKYKSLENRKKETLNIYIRLFFIPTIIIIIYSIIKQKEFPKDLRFKRAFIQGGEKI